MPTNVKMTGCLKIVSRMSQDDQDNLLKRLDDYMARGVPASQAQHMAAQDTLEELQQERQDYVGATREQHAQLFPLAKSSAEAAPAPEAPLPVGEATELPAETAGPAKPMSMVEQTQAGYDAAAPEPPAALQARLSRIFQQEGPSRLARAKTAVQQAQSADGRQILKGSLQEWASWAKERFITNAIDQYRAINTKLSERNYMLARLTSAHEGTLEAFLSMGKVKVDGDVVDVVYDGKGGFLGELARTTKGEHQQFLKWVAALRADKLMKQKREHLFTPEDIEAFLHKDTGLASGAMKDGTQRIDAYQEALQMLTDYNEAILRVAMQRGILNAKLYEDFKDDPYLPFWRVMEKEAGAIRWSTALTGQEMFKALKGGSGKLPDDLLSNVVQNWSHVFQAAAKNHAATSILDEASDLGFATKLGKLGDKIPLADGTEHTVTTLDLKNSVWVMANGVPFHYKVHDEDLAEAIGAMSYAMPDWQKPLASFKRVLTRGVTSLPGFKVKNLIRDSLQSLALDDRLDANVLKNWDTANKALQPAQAFKNLANTLRGNVPASFLPQNQSFATMLSTGALMRLGSMVEGNNAVHAAQSLRRLNKGVLLDAKGGRKLLDMLDDAASAYNELGDVSEQSNRAALFDALIKKGYSKAEAAFASRDLMDFTLQGKAPLMRFLVQTVPFLNARTQGLFRLAKAATSGKKYDMLGINQRFANVAGGIAMASLALMLAQQDDPDWKDREDWDRDSYWWIKIGSTAFRIPKPFEVGSIGTLAERTWELMFDKDMSMRRYADRISDMLTGTFAFNPTPQFAKPFIDIYANKDSFTGRSIESAGMQERMPADRYNERTSMVARMLGSMGIPNPMSFVNNQWSPSGQGTLSPAQIDYLIGAYFGGLATTLLGAVDFAARPATGQGEKPATNMTKFLSSNLVDPLTGAQSRYVQLFYDRAEQVHQAFQTYQNALKMGDSAKALQVMADNRDLIRQNTAVEAAKKELGQLSAQAQRIGQSKMLDADTKRAQLDEIDRRRARITKQVDDALPVF
jgi:hypothetical protein